MNLKHFLLLALLPVALNARAQTHTSEFGFQSDNDSFLGQGSDRYYTNGLFLFYRRAADVAGSKLLQNKIWGIEAGQKIFNPQSGAIADRNEVDRPFAGYLYLAPSLNLLYNNESNLKLEAQAGVIGPAALGKQAQQVIHNTFGFYHLQGWQYQVRNSFQLNLSAAYNRLLVRGQGADVTFNSHAALGTGFSGAGAGVMLRLGSFNQLFNSFSTQSSVIKNRQLKPLHEHEFFFYYKPALNYVAYDATIEGGLFQSHHNGEGDEITLTRKPVVFSNQFGAAYSGNRWTFDFDIVFNTRDTREMLKAHQWGSATILYRFN